MPLEATMILIDNSEYMRNGDYQPTRFEAQSDAVNSVFQAKTDSNPENLVGLMTMAGKGPEVLVTNTKDLGLILGAIHTASGKVGGTTDIPTAISVAQLALKHRQNKNLRQRIVVFVGSPLLGDGSDEKSMVKLAKKLKKNNVAVDLIAFGEGIDETNSAVLKAFVENASSGENSHFLSIPPGLHLLSDLVNSSPILAEDRGYVEGAFGGEGAGPSNAGAAGGFEFGVDPSLDPELAAALRMSMEEEQARQAAAAQSAGTEASTVPAAPSSAPAAAEAPAATTAAEPTDDEEAALLKQALALSQGDDVEMEVHADDDDDEMDEEEAIARAIQMSMEQQQSEKKDKDAEKK